MRAPRESPSSYPSEVMGDPDCAIDVAPAQPLDALTLTPQRCVFPFERLVDPAIHPTLIDRVGTSAMVGQYAFGATPRHPFLRAILRYVRHAALYPDWVQVPRPPPGDEDDTKTVHYTTGPAIVTRAFAEGGFLHRVLLLYASSLGPSDPAGWGGVGAYGWHLHAGSWKANTELDRARLLARASNHTSHGRHEAAARVLKRLLLHGGGDANLADLEALWHRFHESHARAVHPDTLWRDRTRPWWIAPNEPTMSPRCARLIMVVTGGL